MSSQAPEPAVSGEHSILLVEDEDAVRRIVCKVLRNQGFFVIEAENGREALARVEERNAPLDLLITDVVMPDMSGGELASRLAAKQPGLRILFISGYPEHEVMRRGIAPSGASFLEKPFTPTILTRRVRQMLAK